MLTRMEFDHDGHHYEAECRSSAPTVKNAEAPQSKAMWYVRKDGGPERAAFPASPDDQDNERLRLCLAGAAGE